MRQLTDRSLAIIFALFTLSLNPLFPQKIDMDLMGGIKPRNIGPAGMSGRVTSIDVLLSDPSVIYVGSAAGGLWYSDNGGDTWQVRFTRQNVASIGAVVINQNNPAEIWVGTGEGNPRNSQNSGNGIYKSQDGGLSWQHMGLENTRTIHRIIQNPQNPQILVVAATGSAWGDSPHRGIYKTVDGGKTWTKTLYINERTGASDLVVDPQNPNKLYAGMWEYRRWPWFFKSGGSGSGIYISHDGGSTWEPRTSEDGLPEGEIGRIGLAIAPSLPNVVYAYVESAKNAIYRSEDGGKKWKKVSKDGDKNIGGRPFYYADIYVDTQNENRVYSIATEVTISEDGGKTWAVFVPGDRVHTDHHAWWGHPENNEFILLGHDGGLNISYDRGKKWRFFDNLPLAQFYHVRVDNEFPYNVYGGLQDNGSWRGPSQVWFKGGIRNMYWQRLSIGDGFDMVADPLNSDYGWSMGQKGNLFRYHIPTGQLLRVKPQHQEGEPFRFNWNAGIALDPFDKNVVYYGSQYLLKTADHGASWEVISPDLTTNDPEKQKQLITGGLTYDNTGAENYTTIITVVPSEIQQGLIWVGTDDGKIQLTQDGGESWTEVGSRINGVPEETWVPHIHVSTYNAGEAFVVFDDHRRDNWAPYIFHTKDFGRSWTRVVDERDVWGFAYTFVQDPVAPDLYFCGTESGLYVSVDAGANWSKWNNGYPTVPTMDMVIHPREGDLVLGTFGRAFWILDDLSPLREISQKGVQEVMDDVLFAYSPPDAYLVNIGESFGYRYGKVGDALFEGENRPYGALISYYTPEIRESSGQDKDPLMDSVRIDIMHGERRIRTLYQSPLKGINRINWELDRDEVRRPGTKAPDKEKPIKGGVKIPPGEYQIVISYMEETTKTTVKVHKDPRLDLTDQQITEKARQLDRVLAKMEVLTRGADRLRDSRESIEFINEKLKKTGNHKDLVEAGLAMKDSLQMLLDAMFPPDDTQGIYRDPTLVETRLVDALYLMDSPLVPFTRNQEIAVANALESADDFIDELNKFYQGPWKEYQQQVRAVGSLLIPSYEALK